MAKLDSKGINAVPIIVVVAIAAILLLGILFYGPNQSTGQARQVMYVDVSPDEPVSPSSQSDGTSGGGSETLEVMDSSESLAEPTDEVGWIDLAQIQQDLNGLDQNGIPLYGTIPSQSPLVSEQPAFVARVFDWNVPSDHNKFVRVQGYRLPNTVDSYAFSPSRNPVNIIQFPVEGKYRVNLGDLDIANHPEMEIWYKSEGGGVRFKVYASGRLSGKTVTKTIEYNNGVDRDIEGKYFALAYGNASHTSDVFLIQNAEILEKNVKQDFEQAYDGFRPEKLVAFEVVTIRACSTSYCPTPGPISIARIEFRSAINTVGRYPDITIHYAGGINRTVSGLTIKEGSISGPRFASTYNNIGQYADEVHACIERVEPGITLSKLQQYENKLSNLSIKPKWARYVVYSGRILTPLLKCKGEESQYSYPSYYYCSYIIKRGINTIILPPFAKTWGYQYYNYSNMFKAALMQYYGGLDVGTRGGCAFG